MAIYKLNSNKKKKEKNPNVKKIVGFSFIGFASVVFFLLTGIVKPLQVFFLGLFGVFAWPLCIILLVVGLALVNNRRYVMSKKYTICLVLSTVFLLCILQLAVVGGKSGNFWQYMALNYTKTWTPGGFVVGLLTTIFLYITNIYGAYIIFSLALVLCVALLVDSINALKKDRVQQEPVSVQLKDKKHSKTERNVENVAPEQTKMLEEVNVMLDGNLKEQEKVEDKPLTAREILGLNKKRNDAYEFHPNPNSQKKEEVKQEKVQPKSLREMILTPPEINLDEYFKDFRKQQQTPEVKEVEKNLQSLKTEQIPEQEEKVIEQEEVVREDEFVADTQPIVRKNLPEVEVEEIVAEADDILRSAIEEEKNENPEIFENAKTVDPERNLLERLPERDNSGSFEKEKPVGRLEFERKFTDRANVNRFMTQEDKDARADFHRNEDRFNARNGQLAREVSPIPEEEDEPLVEPYVYEKPPIDFLTTKSVDLSTLGDDVATKRVMLENTLETFGVPAKVQGVVIAPAVTRYELEMPQGVAVSKIKNRKDDIALSLAAEGAIRIEAPVPGKSVVGVEVPNDTIATVGFRDILLSKEFQTAKSTLTFAMGKDIAGRTICADMAKLTHLLVAGSTGSGKSVCLNAIILSIIYRASPEDVRILLVDPKQVEFACYENLPHMIIPKAIKEAQKAINALTWAVGEMERRLQVLSNARVKDINEFNQTPEVLNGKIKKLPFIVIVIDEVADLMMTGGKAGVEEKLCRLAQMARAAGIHLILATQRPSTDVITGLIKANFPSRISFALTSSFDSMTILGKVGAEDLLGKGDMLYFPNGAKEPSRVQGCYVSTKEINSIVDYVIENNKPMFDKNVEEQILNPNNPNNGSSNGAGYNTEMDPLLPKALKVSIDCGQASASMLRRKFAIGYPKAMRIIDQMEEAGYISSADGQKGRSVLISEEEFIEIFGEDV